MADRVDDIPGIWRSTDEGETWQLLAQHPAGYYTTVQVVTGDMNILGRVYVGFNGHSFVYGDVDGR
ncbi:MAG: hypothetical protein GEU99_12490 [Luteitalea sp.]|nr:hypothetical protein [Luteitalea sp.]